MNANLRRSRTLLIILGLGLGYLARAVFGPPVSETENPNQFLKPLPEIENTGLDDPELDLDGQHGDEADREQGQGLVPPIQVPGTARFSSADLFNSMYDNVPAGTLTEAAHSARDFEHDDRAVFEPHGNQVCASGCALSRHPTGKLSTMRFRQLLQEYALEPITASSPALDELLFYGPQTRELIEADGIGAINSERAGFLWEELKRTHVRISLRVIDIHGEIRSWLPPTRVPLDRRHVFEMETENLQPLVTSGTVKRVGLDHLWVRL